MEFKLKDFIIDIDITRIANIHYFEFTKEYHTKKDNHNFRELIYVDSGNIIVESDSYNGILKNNQIIIHKTNETHSLSCTEDSAPSVIIIGFECECGHLDAFSGAPFTLNSDLQKILTEIIKEGRTVFLPPYDIPNLKDMKKRTDFPFGADQMIKLQLETFFIRMIRTIQNSEIQVEPDAHDWKTYEIYTYINKNYLEPIKLDELCFLFNTNKTTLCNNFKKTYGQTIISYIKTLKINEAKRLMREGKLNLTEISSKLGFNSIHYFSRMFKETESLSPSAYLKKHLSSPKTH